MSPPSLGRVPLAGFPGVIGTTGLSVTSPAIGSRLCGSRGPTSSESGAGEASQVPGQPLRTCSGLRPRGDSWCLARVDPARECRLPRRRGRRLSQRDDFGAHYRAYSLAVYASSGPLPASDAKLASRLVATRVGAGLSPAGLLRKGSDSHVILLAQAWPGAPSFRPSERVVQVNLPWEQAFFLGEAAWWEPVPPE